MSYQLRSNKTYDQELAALGVEMHRWNVTKFRVEPFAVDRRKTWWSVDERRVTLEFERNGQRIVLAMDSQERPVDNLRVLTLGVQSLRLNEVRGIGGVMRDAYLQIEAPKGAPPKEDPWAVLQIAPNAPRSVVDAAYRALAATTHPDKGGSASAFQRIQAAYTAIKDGQR